MTSRVAMLQCWAKFFNVLAHWSIRMFRAKHYEIMSKFVKVMPRNTVASFFRTRCSSQMLYWPLTAQFLDTCDFCICRKIKSIACNDVIGCWFDIRFRSRVLTRRHVVAVGLNSPVAEVVVSDYCNDRQCLHDNRVTRSYCWTSTKQHQRSHSSCSHIGAKTIFRLGEQILV